MKRLCGLLLGIALLGAGARAGLAQDCSGEATADEVLAAEDARYAAQTANDFAALQKLIGNDLVYIHSSSQVDDKDSYLASMQSGTVRYRVMRRSDVKVRIYGCVALLTGLGNFDVTVKGQDLAVELRFHSIWAKRERGLEFISWQATRTPPKP